MPHRPRTPRQKYQLTASVWIRGILAEHYGVPVASVRYRTGGLNAPGRHEKFAVTLPPEIDIAPIPAGRTLSELPAAGELDAHVIVLHQRVYENNRWLPR